MTSDDDRTARYQRQPQDWVPAGEAEQAAVLHAEFALNDVDAAPAPSANERYMRQMLQIMNEHEAERTQAVLARYRPILIEEFGEERTAEVLDHVAFGMYVAEVYERLEPDEAAQAALRYLREHPGSTPADAFNAILSEAPEGDED